MFFSAPQLTQQLDLDSHRVDFGNHPMSRQIVICWEKKYFYEIHRLLNVVRTSLAINFTLETVFERALERIMTRKITLPWKLRHSMSVGIAILNQYFISIGVQLKNVFQLVMSIKIDLIDDKLEGTGRFENIFICFLIESSSEFRTFRHNWVNFDRRESSIFIMNYELLWFFRSGIKDKNICRHGIIS